MMGGGAASGREVGHIHAPHQSHGRKELSSSPVGGGERCGIQALLCGRPQAVAAGRGRPNQSNQKRNETITHEHTLLMSLRYSSAATSTAASIVSLPLTSRAVSMYCGLTCSRKGGGGEGNSTLASRPTFPQGRPTFPARSALASHQIHCLFHIHPPTRRRAPSQHPLAPFITPHRTWLQ